MDLVEDILRGNFAADLYAHGKKQKNRIIWINNTTFL